MAWRRIGDKPLSEAVLVYFTDALLTHVIHYMIKYYPHVWCITRMYFARMYDNVSCRGDLARYFSCPEIDRSVSDRCLLH